MKFVDYNALPAKSKIAALIRALGIQQKDAAKLCGLTEVYFSRIMRGEITIPLTLQKIIERLEDEYLAKS